MNAKIRVTKCVAILILSLALTAGYAQALPDIGSYGYRSAAVSSYYDLISSTFSQIFGKSHTDFQPFEYEISSAEAVDIAKDLWPGIVLTSPVRTKLSGGVWTVTLHGYSEDGPEFGGRVPAGGYAKINARTGEIVSVNRIM
jgi:hypothetical protein